MKADQHIYEFMYKRIPDVIRDKEVLELATGPGLLAKHIAPAAKKIIATDYSEGMIKEAEKGYNPPNLTFETADAMALPYDHAAFGMWYCGHHHIDMQYGKVRLLYDDIERIDNLESYQLSR